MNFNVKLDTTNLDKLENHIKYVERFSKMKNNIKLQKYIQDKFLETVRRVTNERLVGGTTDDEYIEEYKSRHKIRETSDGFILYNDTILPTALLPVSEETAKNYPNGFSIALAFEYGIGIVGQNDAKVGAWDYNINNWNFAWRYTKDGVSYSTYGYSGFEIYRYTAEEIRKNIKRWILEYNENEGV